MKVMIDTNIILDLLLARKPFDKEALKIFKLIDRGDLIGYMTASTITDIYYIIFKKKHSRSSTYKIIGELLKLLRIAPVSEKRLEWLIN